MQFQSPLDKKAIYNLGLRLDHYQTWGWQSSPHLSFAYKFCPEFRFKSSGGHSYRIPSFTDLYYQSPANVGNEDLSPEKAFSVETGLEFKQEAIYAELTYYHRWAEDLIGWVRSSPSAAWQAQNIAKVDVQGLELELSLRPPDDSTIVSEIYAGYIYQYLENEGASLTTKYTLDFLKHHAHLGLNLALPGKLSQNLNLSYKKRVDQRPYFLLDSRISKRFTKSEIDWEIFLDITNLFNTSYSEQGEVAMPGRWVIGGLRVKL